MQIIKNNICEQIIDHIVTQIKNGELKPGGQASE